MILVQLGHKAILVQKVHKDGLVHPEIQADQQALLDQMEILVPQAQQVQMDQPAQLVHQVR